MKQIYFLYLIFFIVSINLTAQSGHHKRQKIENIRNYIDSKRSNDNKLSHFRSKTKRSNFDKSTLDIKKRLDSMYGSRWDENTAQWVNLDGYKYEFIYDTNENSYYEITYDWNQNTSRWVLKWKWEGMYDANSNLISYISFEWDENTSQWVLQDQQKYEFTYDSNGNATLKLFYNWDSTTSQWVISSKREYTYDANGNQILEIDYERDFNTSQWVISSKREYTYDANGNPTLHLFYFWDSNNSQWILQYQEKYEYTYDANGNPTLQVYYNWDSNTSQWVISSKFEYTYDINGNPTLQLFYNWDSNNSQWIIDKEEYTYDLAYSISELLIPDLSWFLPDNYWNIVNMPIDAIGYNFLNQSFVLDWKEIYYYSDIDSSLSIEDDLLTQAITFYPNPVTNILTIDSEIPLTKVEVYSVLGKRVKEIKSNFESIPTSNLSNGVYFAKIYSENGIATKKLIKN